MTLQILWFILWGVLWAAYFMLDGFDFGAGALYNFLARTEAEKSLVRRSLGPVWDGNEVWLLTAGGATFAAFPSAYAALFSFFYTALLLVLFALIVRGVSIEFRAKGETARWKRGWDLGIGIGSFLPAILFGVAFGNLFRGLPIDVQGYHGTLLTLLNPYGLLTGVLFLCLFLVHGAAWVSLRTDGEFSERTARLAGRLWWVLLITAINFIILSYFETNLAANYRSAPVLLVVPVLTVLALVGIKLHLTKAKAGMAFAFSCAAIVLTTATGLIGLYPNLILSRTDPASSLTIFNSSSSPLTLTIMTVVVLVFIPLVIGYQTWIYRIFRKKLNDDAGGILY
jgi:cytochrome bd ubiquinol oxidase subunit II